MKDIDFDELDKAVNSLVAKKKAPTEETNPQPPLDTPEPPKPEPVAQKTETPPIQPSTSSESQEEKIEPKIKTAQKLTPSHRARLAPKPVSTSRGSFIDIMAPKPTPKNPSRTGQTIQPTSAPKAETNPQPPLDTPEPPKPEPVAQKTETPPIQPPALSESKEEIKQEKPKAPNNPGAALWPDPLDFHKQEESSKEDSPEEKKEESQPEVKTDANSPFIKGAKVEKRPLGAFSSNKQSAPKADSLDFDSLDKQVDMERDVQIPDELHPDVVAVESDLDTSKYEHEKEVESNPPQHESAPVSEVIPEQPSRQQLHDTAMMSIPKQYKTKEKSADNKARPVFDTKEYHPPLLESSAPAAHKGGRILKSIAITAVIVAAAAAAGYFAFLYFIENF